MFLKALTIKGFKSFADAAVLEMEPGVAVVVGPNGSGKSNVVDAIAWVLGAQAPSAVRSQKMDDVIFAGSAQRPALGRAEVSLTIDNSAKLLPIDFTEVTVSRTLFRSGESEYAINGVNCRLLDVQELLSDSGVGRQQHVIISQGQIDAVLNSRPEDRRAIIEEAAGVLKFRRRKEKSQRRLDATEGNLLRLQDLLREVRRNLRPLERQADAARRHGAVVVELAALRLHLAGREIGSLRTRLATLDADLGAAAGREAEAVAAVARLDLEVAAAEAELADLGGFDLGDELARFEALRERARGLGALLVERRRGIERDRGSLLGAGVVATLEAEAARLALELAEVDAAAEALVPEAARLAEADEVVAAERAEVERTWGTDLVVAPPAQAREVRAELGGLRKGVERGQAELARTANRLASLDERRARRAAELEGLRGEVGAATASVAVLAEAVAAAEADRVAAEGVAEQAEVARREADAERHRWAARADALGAALDDARAQAGAERLAGVDGVVGALLELVEVDEGWQQAFEAAAGEALAAVVVDGPEAAGAALEHLAAAGATGAVLPAGMGSESASPASTSLSASVAAALSQAMVAIGAELPTEPVRRHVQARGADPSISSLLDRLVGGAVAVAGGWRSAFEAARRFPEAVVVTRAGDRFTRSGWRLGASGAGATAAALDDARARAAATHEVAADAEAFLATARGTLRSAREAEAAAGRAVEANRSALAGAVDRVRRLEGEEGEGAGEVEGLRAHHDELAARVTAEQAAYDELAATLPALEQEEAEAAERIAAARRARAALAERVGAVAALRTDLEVRAAGIDERRVFLRGRAEELEARLEADAVERAEAEVRRVRLDRQLVAVDRLAALVQRRAAEVDAELAELGAARRAQSEQSRQVAERVAGVRRERTAEHQRLDQHRQRARALELEQAEVRLRLEQAVEALTGEQGATVDEALAASAVVPPLPEGTTAGARLRDLERELRLMGPINPLALEEFEALQERSTFLEGQLEDVRTTRRELQRVITAVDAEIVHVFSSAFADVAANFESLFSTLFPGGQGRLVLTEPGDLLSTGIEVEAKPSGKNVRKLSLLSGGERSLTALAFLFAVFRSRPSPFYVMDEVEAALDDVNLHRFLDLVHEFRSEAQLIIVSHQKRTMEAADCLFGVTMQPGGSSRVISEKVAAG